MGKRRTNNVRNARLLLQVATVKPDFAGDFEALAAEMGWTSGTFWRQNPAIKIASARWCGAKGAAT